MFSSCFSSGHSGEKSLILRLSCSSFFFFKKSILSFISIKGYVKICSPFAVVWCRVGPVSFLRGTLRGFALFELIATRWFFNSACFRSIIAPLFRPNLDFRSSFSFSTTLKFSFSAVFSFWMQSILSLTLKTSCSRTSIFFSRMLQDINFLFENASDGYSLLLNRFNKSLCHLLDHYFQCFHFACCSHDYSSRIRRDKNNKKKKIVSAF